MNKSDFKIKTEENKVIFNIDLSLYELEVVYGTCYHLVDDIYIYLKRGSRNNEIEAHLKGKDNLNKKGLEDIAGRFFNELINVGFRYQISRKNHKIREYIAGAALAGASLEIRNKIKNNKECGLGQIDDPEGILIPWEEKNNKKDADSDSLYKENEEGLVIPWRDEQKADE